MATKQIKLELNRVEGDLEIRLELTGHQVTNAWVVGTMYRGFEQILRGRAGTDGIVITPRICGICGTAHQYAAVSAIERIYGCQIAPHGTRIRNLCVLAEEVQSDARHTFLMFTVDFCHSRYGDHPMATQVRSLFEPFRGRIYREAVQQSKDILKVVGLVGGQWPHSSQMVPGGTTARCDVATLVKCLAIVGGYARWYEQSVLGCSIDRWLSLRSAADLESWLDHSAQQRDCAMGTFLRFGRSIGLGKIGRGNGNLLSYGSIFDPEAWQPPFDTRATWRSAGFRDGQTQTLHPFDESQIAEHVRHSWTADYVGGRHPSAGETVPNYAPETEKYSWAKAPRYGGKVVELGVLADLVAAGDPLMTALVNEWGTNCLVRQMARLHRPAVTLSKMRSTLQELLADDSAAYFLAPTPRDGSGSGLVSAARGGLGHWVDIRGGKIDRYQIITPTAWNASPRDSEGTPGLWEQCIIGTELVDPNDPVELGHIVRSFDACLVCTVHMMPAGKTLRFLQA